jgi:hypothetical protein
MDDRPNEELDLIKLAAGFIRMLKRNMILILVCVGFTMGLAVWIAFMGHKTYESRMMLYSDILTESYCDHLAVNIEAIIKERNYKLLANRLNISEAQASKLKGIKIEGALEPGTAAQEAEKLFLVVTVRVSDNSVLPDLQVGIISFIGQNDFVKVRTQEKKQYYEKLIAKVGEEIEKLEKIKEKIAAGTYRSESGIVVMDPADPYSKTVELYRDKLGYEEALRLVNSVQLVEGFTPLNKQVSPKLSLLLPAGLASGFVVAFSIMAISYLIRVSREDA